MTDHLSSAARVIMDAYGNEVGGVAAITSYERRGVAAALRAAALYCKRDKLILISIADELEKEND